MSLLISKSNFHVAFVEKFHFNIRKYCPKSLGIWPKWNWTRKFFFLSLFLFFFLFFLCFFFFCFFSFQTWQMGRRWIGRNCHEISSWIFSMNNKAKKKMIKWREKKLTQKNSSFEDFFLLLKFFSSNRENFFLFVRIFRKKISENFFARTFFWEFFSLFSEKNFGRTFLIFWEFFFIFLWEFFASIFLFIFLGEFYLII